MVLIAGIIHVRPVLDISLTPLYCHQHQYHAMLEFNLPILDRFPRSTLHLGQGRPQRPAISDIKELPAILLEDSHSQTILKFQVILINFDLHFRE